jgi:SAM-dependent methyltransferase
MRRAANVWDRFYRHHEAPWRGERPVAQLVPLLGAGPVLELGCGNGKLLRPLRAAGVEAIGLDVAFHALRRLAPGTPRVLADAAVLPFRDDAFTAVLDVHCTGHLGAAGRAAAALEAARVLRPGGLLVVERLTPADLRASQGKPVEGEPGMKEVEDGRRTHFAFAPELVAAFAAAGFTPTSTAGPEGAEAAETGEVTRREPGHRGRQVVRESVRLAFRRGTAPG